MTIEQLAKKVGFLALRKICYEYLENANAAIRQGGRITIQSMIFALKRANFPEGAADLYLKKTDKKGRKIQDYKSTFNQKKG